MVVRENGRTHQQGIMYELEQQRLDSDESMASKTPSQGSSKTNNSRNSFDVLAYNNEDENYDEVDMYTFKVNTLQQYHNGTNDPRHQHKGIGY
jgi:hypothetical protein